MERKGLAADRLAIGSSSGYGLVLSVVVLVIVLLALLLCLVYRKDATVRWLYAYIVGWPSFATMRARD